jgi:hypothetical protein
MDGLGTLGTIVIVVAFTCLRSWTKMKKDWITLIMSEPTILYAFLKKLILNPSGSGALLSLWENKEILNFTIHWQGTCFEREIISEEEPH